MIDLPVYVLEKRYDLCKIINYNKLSTSVAEAVFPLALAISYKVTMYNTNGTGQTYM